MQQDKNTQSSQNHSREIALEAGRPAEAVTEERIISVSEAIEQGYAGTLLYQTGETRQIEPGQMRIAGDKLIINICGQCPARVPLYITRGVRIAVVPDTADPLLRPNTYKGENK